MIKSFTESRASTLITKNSSSNFFKLQSTLLNIPGDLQSYIFKLLDPKSLAICAHVCKQLYPISVRIKISCIADDFSWLQDQFGLSRTKKLFCMFGEVYDSTPEKLIPLASKIESFKMYCTKLQMCAINKKERKKLDIALASVSKLDENFKEFKKTLLKLNLRPKNEKKIKAKIKRILSNLFHT